MSIFAGLTTDQVAALTTTQIAALTTADMLGLTQVQTPALTTADIALLSTANIQAIPTADISFLTTAQLAALGTGDISVLTTAQVAAFNTSQLQSLSTAQINQGLTIPQIQAMTSAQLIAMTTAQAAAFTTTQIYQGLAMSPIPYQSSKDGKNCALVAPPNALPRAVLAGTTWKSGGMPLSDPNTAESTHYKYPVLAATATQPVTLASRRYLDAALTLPVEAASTMTTTANSAGYASPVSGNPPSAWHDAQISNATNTTAIITAAGIATQSIKS